MFKNSRLHNKYDESIEAVRPKVIEQLQSCPDVYAEDVENKIKNNDTFIRRFLVFNNGSVTTSVDQIVSTLKYYKSQGFNELTDDYFPSEMWYLGGVFLYECDNKGHPSLYVRLRSCIKVPEINDFIKNFISYLIWKLDQVGSETGWVMIFDFEEASMMNADIDIAKFFVNIIKQYFPLGLNYTIAVDTPWYIRTFWTLVKTLIPADKRSLLMMSSKADMVKYFNLENLPKFVGGTCTRKYQGKEVVPLNSPNSIDFGVEVLGFKREKSEKLFKNFNHLITLVEKEESC